MRAEGDAGDPSTSSRMYPRVSLGMTALRRSCAEVTSDGICSSTLVNAWSIRWMSSGCRAASANTLLASFRASSVTASSRIVIARLAMKKCIHTESVAARNSASNSVSARLRSVPCPRALMNVSPRTVISPPTMTPMSAMTPSVTVCRSGGLKHLQPVRSRLLRYLWTVSCAAAHAGS